MYKLVKLEKTCLACPSQWEGQINDGRWIYIRYRWGDLIILLSKKNISIKHINFFDTSETIFTWKSGELFDGVMSIERLIYLTSKILDFSNVVSKYIKFKMKFVNLYYKFFSTTNDPWLKLKINKKFLKNRRI